MRYYIGKNGTRLGPFDAQEVRAQLDSGAISLDDLVWREGMPAWAPVRSEFPPPDVPPPPPDLTIPPSFGAPPMVSSTPAPVDIGPVLAGRGRRLAGALVDFTVALLCLLPGVLAFWPRFMELIQESVENNTQPDEALVQKLYMEAAGPWMWLLLVLFVVQMALLTLRGQSVGKLVCGTRIVRLNGDRAGFVHAFLLRYLVFNVATGIPVLGMLLALINPLLIFREDRRCLHDLLAGTAVVDA
jgi:Predicted membrane protein/domain